MQPSELQLGDIVCFHTKAEVPEHVAMFTGFIDGKPYVTHSVVNDTPGLQTTILKNVGRLDVFRPVNAELGKRAAQRLLEWAKYKVPYDTKRRDCMLLVSDNLKKDGLRENTREPIEHAIEYLQAEARTKFYERIKFASRRETCPVKLLENVKARGFTCVQAIILAYQVEELASYVKTLEQVQIELSSFAETVEQIKEVWISDKHCPADILENYPLPESYVKYSNALRDKEELSDFCFNDKRKTPSHEHYHPSLVAWRFDKAPNIDEFINGFHSVLNLPAKFCFTDALYGLMLRNQNDWQNMGLLARETLPLTFSPQEKSIHRQRLSAEELMVQINRSDISRERALSPSSLESPSPRGSFRRISSAGQIISGATSPLLERVYSRLSPE